MAPYGRRVPRKHQRVLLALHRAYAAGQPALPRMVAHKSGVRLSTVFRVLDRLHKHGWAEKEVISVSYSWTIYGFTLTPAGYDGVNALMSRRRRRQHRKTGRCKWHQPDRMEGERGERVCVRAGT
jgi:hypothetical protein